MAQWMVRSEGTDPIGPVTTELLLRGIAQGRVPVESEVQELGTAEWQILEFVDVFADAIQSDDAMTRLAESPLDADDVLAYADAEEAFTRLAVPGAPRGDARPPPPAAGAQPRRPPPPPPTSARHRAPPPPPPARAADAYSEDDDAATRVASSPFNSELSQPPSVPQAALPPPTPAAGSWPSAPHATRPSNPQQAQQSQPQASQPQAPQPQAAQPALPQPTYSQAQPSQPVQQQAQEPYGAPQQAAQVQPARSGGSTTALLAFVVLLLAGCLGVLLWLLSSR